MSVSSQVVCFLIFHSLFWSSAKFFFSFYYSMIISNTWKYFSEILCFIALITCWFATELLHRKLLRIHLSCCNGRLWLQDQLAGSLSVVSVNPVDSGSVMPLSPSQFCVPSRPLHAVCQPVSENDPRPYRFMPPNAAAIPSGSNNSAAPLMTLPQMTVQSIEAYPTYPLALHLQPNVVHQQQQQANTHAQTYCFEVSSVGQLKQDAAHKGNGSSVFYTPLGMQMPLAVQPVRYHHPIGCSLNAPFQSVICSDLLAETVQPVKSSSTQPSLQYVYYSALTALGHSTESAISQISSSINSSSTRGLLPVNTSCSAVPPASSEVVGVQSCNQSHFESNLADFQSCPVAYRHAINLPCSGKYCICLYTHICIHIYTYTCIFLSLYQQL